ncbi:MAG TPA: porin family protein [Flavobacteriaceae bacterium]|nr:porin family protein [Flavobacteriaceae bacterium]
MKKLILIISVFIFTISTIQAQKNVTFGAKAGINLSNLSSDNFTSTKMRTGFHLGLLAEIPLSNIFSIQPELLYSTQGTKASQITLGGDPVKTDYKLDYIQVPILAKVYLTESLSLEAGPSFNFLIKEEIDERKTDFGSNFEFAGTLGASYMIKGGFFVNARYFYGFTNALNTFTTTYNNSGFQIGVGFIF